MTTSSLEDAKPLDQVGWCRNQPAKATAGNLSTGSIRVTLLADATSAEVTDMDFIAFGEYTQPWLQFLCQLWARRASSAR